MEKIYRFNTTKKVYELIYGCDLKFTNVYELISYLNSEEQPPGWYHGSIQRQDIVSCRGQWYMILGADTDSTICVDIEDINKIECEFADDNTIRTVMVMPQKPAYELIVVNELKAMQSAVGGLIEAFYPDRDDVKAVAYVNDEGILLKMPPNRLIEETIIFGNMIIIGSDDEGNDISLTREQTDKYLDMFSEAYTLDYDAQSGTLFIF